MFIVDWDLFLEFIGLELLLAVLFALTAIVVGILGGVEWFVYAFSFVSSIFVRFLVYRWFFLSPKRKRKHIEKI